MNPEALEQLKAYVAEQLKAGVNEAELRETIKKEGGWSDEDLAQVFPNQGGLINVPHAPTTPSQTPAPDHPNATPSITVRTSKRSVKAIILMYLLSEILTNTYLYHTSYTANVPFNDVFSLLILPLVLGLMLGLVSERWFNKNQLWASVLFVLAMFYGNALTVLFIPIKAIVSVTLILMGSFIGFFLKSKKIFLPSKKLWLILAIISALLLSATKTTLTIYSATHCGENQACAGLADYRIEATEREENIKNNTCPPSDTNCIMTYTRETGDVSACLQATFMNKVSCYKLKALKMNDMTVCDEAYPNPTPEEQMEVQIQCYGDVYWKSGLVDPCIKKPESGACAFYTGAKECWARKGSYGTKDYGKTMYCTVQ